MTYQPPQHGRQPVSGQGYGPPPPGWPGAQPPKKKRKWPWVAVGFAVLTVFACTGVMRAGGAANDSAGSTDGQKAVTGKMGTPGRDGKFEFTVTGMQCGKRTVGSGFSKSTAQGTYCLVTVKVRNIGKQAQTFDGFAQKAYDAKGVQYSNDSSAEFDVNDGASTWSEQINPGNGVTGVLVFDVPATTKLTSIELHDSVWSDGVKVPLR